MTTWIAWSCAAVGTVAAVVAVGALVYALTIVGRGLRGLLR